ncbi:peptidylprolyl isomerase [[Haemophilus] ducreyi]|uniref:Periplasmic chaperone PpiD n=2 Tax=Haemophilus ducreyi TaxID=730 RepID=PPID_HAEDU|nr:SurA N-terminal domain-containing protein [[Haemophilus] ducreyi]Q7VKX4.1 RecName: Full=Periplasmic chaperone PpiD; AltName: Full=Periplasmic folding chaperone [[Haemophilus] ducreyi 35000HP]AAP96493.1 peptidyl-prolyl cis-trans isomerase D [[Haemophilus] ducreyi 35000HP]AKO31353.1 peptidylprolyl isomerase [[Haemophilus] ducreyi]AKO32804.1 peptidylprolyl isomerase [[Haemophilus] ducreyi]AKO34253.1 peptidylprolyl isomerase [[Haemophilus] ducreyi]AKO35696.1 peptidylprolyl isomerase [[Haemophi
MIEKMHERTNSVAFKVIFALVSLSFVLTGIGTGLVGADTSAVKVNGTTIDQHAFNTAKARQQNVLNAQLGERFWDLLDTPEYAKQFNQSVLDGLVNDELMRQYAKDLKLGISANQIKSQIVNSQIFQQDGKFNNELYQHTLRNNGLTADGYAAIVNEGMLLSQIQKGIVESDFSVPVTEALLAKLLLQQRQVRLATYPIAKEIANQTASVEELQKYYDAKKTDLVEPEQLVVEYVTFMPKDIEKNIQVTDEQVATYYEKNKADFVTKGETHLAHIQLANEEKAKQVAEALKQGTDFAMLANDTSTDSLSAQQGGDLGWTKAGIFPEIFEQTANALAINEVSEPVKVDNNYHIIKVLDRKEDVALPFEMVKDKIVKIIRDELLLTEYSNISHEMANKAFENSSSLAEVAQIAGVNVQTSTQFNREHIPADLNNEKVIKALFNGELRQSGQNSDALDVGNEREPKTMFVRVRDFYPERVRTFDEAKADIEQIVKHQKAEQLLLAKAEENVKALNEGNAVNVDFNEAETLVYAKRADNPILFKTVFAMQKPTDKPTYQVTHNQQGDVVIVSLEKVIDGKQEEFAPLASQLKQLDQTLLRNDLLKDLRSRASVDVNQNFIEQLK